MANRQFVSRHGKLVNRAHLDKDFPYRYQCDPVRYLAARRRREEDNNKLADINYGLKDYFNQED